MVWTVSKLSQLNTSAARSRTCIVDEHVQLRQLFSSPGGKVLDAVRLADVQRLELDLRALHLGLDVLHSLLASVRAPGCQDSVQALPGQDLCYGQADALVACAGTQR